MPPKTTPVRHEFVEFIPETLAERVLYVSIPYNTIAHRCLCGCGNKVITPLSPTDWKVIYDGKSVSLRPSVGSWNLRCRSHYVIDGNIAKWADSWSPEQVAEERERDHAAKALYYGRPPAPQGAAPSDESSKSAVSERRSSLATRLARLLGLG